MAPSPSKRRRLSSTAPNPQSLPATPNPTQATADVARTMNSRPSFASPTKASIAKHNPQLLARTTSADIGDIRLAEAENMPPEEQVRKTLFVTPAKVQGTDANAIPLQGPMMDSEVPPARPTPVRETRSSTGGLSAPARRRSRTPGKELPRASTVVSESVNLMSKRRAPEYPNTTEKAITPRAFRSAGLRRSPLASQGIDALAATQVHEPLEPELPLTPTQRGLLDPVVTTPPSGIHNTPSKRSKRLRGKRAKPSPLKAQAETTIEEEPAERSDLLERPGKRRKASEYASRYLVPTDPHAEKKKLRDQLLEEVQGLQSDIGLAEKENERLRRHYSSSKALSEPPLSDEILGLLVRATAEINPQPPPPKPTSIFNAIGSFLPFAPRPRPPLIPLKETLLPSHLPVKVQDQLPYLRLFTPLKYSSTTTLLPPTPPSSGDKTFSSTMFQNHAISIIAPSGLFTARLNLIVDASRFSVSSLTIPSLDPAAEDELGRWARERASGKGILGRDISAICWAMARWYEVAKQRAKFWCEIERRFGTEEARRNSNVRVKAVAAKLRKRKGNSNSIIEEAGQGTDNEDDREVGESSSRWTRKQLWPQMSRRTMVLGNESVELKIGWDITFDWTGEAESCISGCARVPTSWQEKDERRSLTKIPETFDHLVKSRGPLVAVRAMVALLMP